MKIILTQDVENLGHAMDVVEVADGFARNYLLPRSLAMSATKSSLAALENLRRIEERKQSKLKGSAAETATKLDGKVLVFDQANVGSEGRLYGSIGTANIAEALKAQFDADVNRHQILLSDPIRTEGFHTVQLRLHREVTVDLKVKVGNPKEEVAVEAETETAEVAVA